MLPSVCWRVTYAAHSAWVELIQACRRRQACGCCGVAGQPGPAAAVNAAVCAGAGLWHLQAARHGGAHARAGAGRIQGPASPGCALGWHISCCARQQVDIGATLYFISHCWSAQGSRWTPPSRVHRRWHLAAPHATPQAACSYPWIMRRVDMAGSRLVRITAPWASKLHSSAKHAE